LNYNRDLNDFLNDSLNVLIDSNYFRNNSLDLDKLRDVHSLLNYPLHLINFRYFSYSINYFFWNLFYDFKFLNDFFDWNNLLNISLNFDESFLNVRNDFFNFFYSLLNDNVFNSFFNFNHFNLLLLDSFNFFSPFINLLNFSVNPLNWNNFLNDSIDGNLNFYRDDHLFNNWNRSGLLYDMSNNFLNFKSTRNLSVLNHDSLCYNLLNLNIFLVDLISN